MFLPPIKKFSKEKIIDVAYNLAKDEGLESINARRIASILGSSVQPIFHNFKNMEELKKTIYERAYKLYQEYMNSGIDKENPYKEMGLAYIKYARYYPNFFKAIFMQETPLNAENFIMADSAGNNVIKMCQKLTGLDFENSKNFHIKVWIFTHGIACLVATKTINISEEEVSELLESSVREMAIGYVQKKGKKNEINK